MNGCIGSTMAPAASNARAAASTAARTSGSTGSPQPASINRPSFRPRTSRSSCCQAMVWYGRLIVSRTSGRLSVAISSAASPTVRVIGPATRPAYGGWMGMRPRLGFSAKTPHQPAGRRTEPPMSVPTCSGP